MYTNYYKDGKLIHSQEHQNGVAFEDAKDIVIEILCTLYPKTKVDEAVTVSKTKGSFRTKLTITQTKIS